MVIIHNLQQGIGRFVKKTRIARVKLAWRYVFTGELPKGMLEPKPNGLVTCFCPVCDSAFTVYSYTAQRFQSTAFQQETTEGVRNRLEKFLDANKEEADRLSTALGNEIDALIEAHSERTNNKYQFCLKGLQRHSNGAIKIIATVDIQSIKND